MGLLLEVPTLRISWRTKLSTFLQTFPPKRLREVATNYYTASCISHGGMQSMIGFHFGEFPLQANEPLLYDIEFFRETYQDLKASFNEFQDHFVRVYGPGQIIGYAEGFPIYRWIIPGAVIKHGVFEHFVLEEHLHILC